MESMKPAGAITSKEVMNFLPSIHGL